jgi:hypothetical protein
VADMVLRLPVALDALPRIPVRCLMRREADLEGPIH